MLAKPALFLFDKAVPAMTITALVENGLVVQCQRTWFGTPPDAVSLTIDAKAYVTAHQNADSGRQMHESHLQSHICSAATDYYKADVNPEWSVRSVRSKAGR